MTAGLFFRQPRRQYRRGMTIPAAELLASAGLADWRGLAPSDWQGCDLGVTSSSCDATAIHAAGLRHERPDGGRLQVTVFRSPARGYDPARVFARQLVTRTRRLLVPVLDHESIPIEVGDIDQDTWVAFGSLPDEQGQVRLDGNRWPVEGLSLVHVPLLAYLRAA